jgi:ectoine hydroxylase-related dioxygenase (phytanoyl-CoA dioxygenase family)
MNLTDKQLASLPTLEDVVFYQEHGYFISGKILSDEEIDDAVYGSERFYAGERDFFRYNQIKPFEGWKPEDGDVLRINDYVSLQNSEIGGLVRSPLLGAIASVLSGGSSIRLWHDQMIRKPSSAPPDMTCIGWHTDKEYWKTCSSDKMLTAWIPLTDCDESMGTLVVVDGSHRWAGNTELKMFHRHDRGAMEREASSPAESFVTVPMKLRKGQVSFHHCRTIHGSGPNLSRGHRHSISVHFQDQSNCYRRIYNQQGDLIWHRNDLLCRQVNGQPDYSDPDICPLLWTDEYDDKAV